MLNMTVQNDRLQFGDRGFAISFQRTLRIPDDGKTYPLPPGLGAFPIRKVADYAGSVPESWDQPGAVFVPLYQREALWLRFHSRGWKPNAVKIAVGRLNAISGTPWDEPLNAAEQDYVVSPPQNWLDGINAGAGFVRQFVAQPLEVGAEAAGGVQVLVYEAKAGRFPDEEPAFERNAIRMPGKIGLSAGVTPGASAEMSLGAGGRMKQKIYPDPHGIDTWDPDNTGRVTVYLVNSTAYQKITGEAPPPSPISAENYRQAGLPWLHGYDEHWDDPAPPEPEDSSDPEDGGW